MKRIQIAAVVLSLFIAVGAAAQEMPEMPKPQKEHEWLRQFAGTWENEGEATPPGQPTVRFNGTETTRMLGGFWMISEGKSEMMGVMGESLLTMGYDPEKKKYVGTWVDSMNSHLWKYEGDLDATGKILTLNSEGPCPFKGGKLTKFKEILEVKGPDQKVFTSSYQEDDGSWVKVMTMTSRRRK
jgi:hypothetical protein